MPKPETVLSEMAALGLKGTELGAPGFLPDDPRQTRDIMARNGLQLVGAFVALVLHTPSFAPAPAQAAIAQIAAADGHMVVLAVVEDEQWSRPKPLTDDGWRRLGERIDEVQTLAARAGLETSLHPHVGTLIETAEQVDRAITELEVPWCLDTGHLFIGGTDPAQFATDHGDRVNHVHLKDVDARLAAAVRTGQLSLLEATKQGLFLPLGKGDARIDAVLEALDAYGYDGWFVLEQDTAITADEPTVQGGPMRDARESIAFLRDSAPTTQEVRT
jgi:inosose dehydratase